MKQRLIGVIVLGCLAIIFLPMLLDGEGVTPTAMSRNIPPGPVIPKRLEIEPVRPVILSDTEELNNADEIAQAPSSAKKESPAKAEIVEVVRGKKPELGVQGIPQSWSVRLASFGNKRNAESLIKKLVADDHKAYSRPSETSQGTLTAVYIGPFLSLSEANQWQSKLEGKYDLSGKGLVVKFTIEELSE